MLLAPPPAYRGRMGGGAFGHAKISNGVLRHLPRHQCVASAGFAFFTYRSSQAIAPARHSSRPAGADADAVVAGHRESWRARRIHQGLERHGRKRVAFGGRRRHGRYLREHRQRKRGEQQTNQDETPEPNIHVATRAFVAILCDIDVPTTRGPRPSVMAGIGAGHRRQGQNPTLSDVILTCPVEGRCDRWHGERGDFRFSPHFPVLAFACPGQARRIQLVTAPG